MERNWAGNLAYRARTLHRPGTVEEVRELAAGAPRIRVLGTRHSFNAIADSDELMSLAGLPADFAVDRAAGTVSFSGGMTYGALAAELDREGLALANLASLPHISVAGAIATATHGSGDRNGNLATAVAALELVTSGGERVTVSRGDADFEGHVVSLGALGAVTRIALDVEPAYDVRQDVFEGLAWPALLVQPRRDLRERLRRQRVHALGRGRGPGVAQEPRGRPRRARRALRRAPGDRRPPSDHRQRPRARDAAARPSRPVVGAPGPLPPELHAEQRRGDPVRVPRPAPARGRGDRGAARGRRSHPRDRARQRAAHRRRRPAVAEPAVRPGHARHPLHVAPRPGRRRARARDVEAALAPFEPRPHWGKVFLPGGAALAARYERLADFTRLAARLDPRGAFRNEWLAEPCREQSRRRTRTH